MTELIIRVLARVECDVGRATEEDDLAQEVGPAKVAILFASEWRPQQAGVEQVLLQVFRGQRCEGRVAGIDHQAVVAHVSATR